jgi:small subunit ribosomal protein S35
MLLGFYAWSVLWLPNFGLGSMSCRRAVSGSLVGTSFFSLSTTVKMAAAAQSLRLALRCSSRRAMPRIQLARPQKRTATRPFSTTLLRRAEEEEPQDVEEEVRIFDNPGDAVQELLRTGELTQEEQKEALKAQKAWEELPIEEKQKIIADVRGVREQIAPLRRPVPKPKGTFWNVDEKDTEMITNEVGEDEFDEDEITSMGHAKLEEHREFREYARIAVWEMPLLASKLGHLRHSTWANASD